eukprot:scaffold114214_cov30-Tisochrysis_lutea.AAC.14
MSRAYAMHGVETKACVTGRDAQNQGILHGSGQNGALSWRLSWRRPSDCFPLRARRALSGRQ